MPSLSPKIVVAFDSFKGSASSLDLSKVAARAIKNTLVDSEVKEFQIADGGEGTTNAICANIASSTISVKVHDPLMRIISADYHITNDGTTAIMEMAATSGLPLLKEEERNPLIAVTVGTGEMILDAINRGCKTIILGIGGSATNDAALGLLSALGFKFRDNKGNDTLDLNLVAEIDESCVAASVFDTKFIIACDVNNPFYGKNGAAYVYAPQKGASKNQVETLDSGLKNLADLVKKNKGIDLQNIPGSGAAGGMGGGLYAFLNAKLQPGIDTILEIVGFEEAVKDASLIITGEGKIDAQSGMGKAIGGILKVGQKHNVPVIAVGGCVESTQELSDLGITAIFPILSAPMSLKEAMNRDVTLNNLERTVSQIIRTFYHINLYKR